VAEHIPQDILEEIRRRSDIVDVISEYLPLKGSAGNYKALCPFHSEKTPSFTVTRQKQIFHCFGCGVGGNVFTSS
jgi:DNA primase